MYSQQFDFYDPYPLIATKPQNYRFDDVFALVNDLNTVKSFVNKSKRKRSTFELIDKKAIESKVNNKLVILEETAIIANFLASTDKYFDGFYNYYYTGGAVKCFLSNYSSNEAFLVYSSYKNAVTSLIVQKIKLNNGIWNVVRTHSARFKLPNKGPVYEIVHNCYDVMDVELPNVTIAVRQKYILTVIKFSIPSMKLKLDKSINFDVPIMSGVILDNKCTAVTDTLGNIIVHNNDHQRCNNKMPNLEAKIDGWNKLVKSPMTSQLICMNRKEINVFDERSHTFSLLTTLDKSKVPSCDLFCNLSISSRYNQHEINIASYHTTYSLDIRMANSYLNFKHHMMTGPPVYMDILNHNTENFISLGSHMPEEIVLSKVSCNSTVENNADFVSQDKWGYYKFPPLSFINENSLLINAIECAKERYRYATVGISMIGVENDVYMFHSNILDDLWVHKIGNKQDDMEKDSDKQVGILTEWLNILPPKYICGEDDGCVINQLHFDDLDKEVSVEKKHSKKQKQHKETVIDIKVDSKFKQVLSEKWNMEEDSQILPQESPSDKVQHWLVKQVFP